MDNSAPATTSPTNRKLSQMGRRRQQLDSHPNHRRTDRRRGVTLFELMLVLALLVVIAAIAFPTLHGAFERQILRKAGEQIRVALAKTRNEAMRGGRIMVFQYEAETGRYRIQPWAQQSDLLEGNMQFLAASGGSSANGLAGNSGAMSPPLTPPGSQIPPNGQLPSNSPFGSISSVRTHPLPSNIVFAGANVGQDARSQTLTPATSFTTPLQAPPIIFYPDGTASDAQIVLKDRSNRLVVVQLRGLTGMTQLVRTLPDGTLPQMQPSTGASSP